MRNTALVVVVFILLLGSIAGLLFVSRSNSSELLEKDISLATSGASTYRNDLVINNLLKEHSAIMTLHLQGLYDGKDTTATEILLDGNKNNISSLVGQLYGREAQSSVNAKWQEHMDLYKSYTIAIKNNDRNMQNEARNGLVKISNELGENFSEMEPKLNSQRVTELMQEHIVLTLDMVDAYASSNFSQEARLTKQTFDQATIFSFYLSENMNTEPKE